MKKQLLILKTRLHCLLLQCEYYNVRDDLGRFAKSAHSGIQDLKRTQSALDVASNYNSDDLVENLSLIKENVAAIKTARNRAYKALGVNNQGMMDASFGAGLLMSDDFQKSLFGVVSGVAGVSEKQVAQIIKDIELHPEKADKILQDSVPFWDSAPATVVRQAVKLDLEHKKNLEQMKHLEDIGYTEWVGQMGREGAFAVELAQQVLPMLGFAALPEAYAAGATTESLIGVLAKAAQGKVVRSTALKLSSEANDAIGEAIGEKPTNIAIGLMAGATVGGALDEVSKQMELHPSALNDEKVNALYQQMKGGAASGAAFLSQVNDAIEATGVDKRLESDTNSYGTFVKSTKEIYDVLPDSEKQKFETLTGEFGRNLKAGAIDETIEKL